MQRSRCDSVNGNSQRDGSVALSTLPNKLRANPALLFGVPRQLLTTLLAISVGLLLLTGVPSALLHGDGGATEAVQQDAAATELFGIFRISTETGLHIVQALIILVVFGLIRTVAKLSRESYVYAWSRAWLILFIAYAYRIFQGLPLPSLPDIVDFSISWLLFNLSTGYVLLTGLHLAAPDTKHIKNTHVTLAVLGLSAAAALLLASFFPQRSMAPDFANGGLAAVATIFAGWQLHKKAPRPLRVPGGLEVLTIFVLYGCLQIGAPWLADSQLGIVLFATSLVLKIPCALSVVAIALRHQFRRYATSQSRLEKKKESLRVALSKTQSANMELVTVQGELKTAKSASEWRQKAFEQFGDITYNSENVDSGLNELLQETLRILRAKRGLIYLCGTVETGTEGKATLAAFAGVAPSPQSQVVNLTSREGTDGLSGHAIEQLKEVAKKGMLKEPLAAFSIRPPGGQGMLGWVLADGVPDNAASEAKQGTLDEAFNRVAIGLDLIMYKERMEFLKLFREILRESTPVDGLLESLAQLTSEKLRANRVIIDISEPKARQRHVIAVQDGKLVDASPVSSYPDAPRCDWRETASVDDNEGVKVIQYSSFACCPIIAGDDESIGVVICENKGALGSGSGDPFTRFDMDQLQIVAVLADVLIKRARRETVLEALLTRTLHELRRPVGNLRNLVRWLGRNVHLSDAESRRAKIMLGRAALELEAMRVRVDMVDPNRERRREPPSEVLIFRDIIRPLETQIRPALRHQGIDGKKIVITMDGQKEIPRLFLVRSKVQEILQNLTDNAIKYRVPTDDGFRVEFEGCRRDGFYLVKTRDWGIGVPEDWVERIFEDGERAPNATQNVEVTGLGMGLNIAREHARSLGGDLRLTSRRNPTEFELSLSEKLRR